MVVAQKEGGAYAVTMWLCPGRAVRVRALISTALQMGILIGMRVQRERLRGTRPASGAVQ